MYIYIKKYKLISIVLITLILVNLKTQFIQGEKKSILCKSITIDQGLSQATVEALFQDSRGYIWIGTNHGLNRYNGYDFKVYKQSENEDINIASNYIKDIKEDKYGNIWVGTIDGVSKINSETGKITNYSDKPNQGNLSHYNTSEILIVKDKIFIGTADGLNLYNEDTDSFQRILQGKTDLVSQDIYSLTRDENGDIWIGTKKGINKITIKEDKYISERIPTDLDNINEIYSDKRGSIWVGTVYKGLSKIDINTNEIKTYVNVKDDKNSIPSNTIRDMLIDSNGNMWICTSAGLSMYVKENDNFINHKSNISDKYSLLNDSTFSIIQDKSGLIWVGTYEGISYFTANDSITHYSINSYGENFLSSNIIHGIYEDDDYLWLGTVSDGLNIINREDESITYLTEDDGLSNNRINFIVGDEYYVWVATNDGLNRIDKKDKSIKVYKQKDGLNEPRIKSLFLDSKDNLWIGSPNGINILDTKTDKIININYVLDRNNISDRYIQCIYEDSEQNYWIGTFINGSLIKLDSNKNKILEYQIKGNSIRSMVEYKDYIWIATNYGLDRLNKITGEIKKYTQEEGLSNDMIYSVVMDNEDNLWMSTNYGISKLDIDKETFTNYNLSDGFQGNEFNGGAYFKNSENEILFGGINGLNIFNPKEVTINDYIPAVEFEEFIINGKSYNSIDNLKLNYSENEVGIRFFLPYYKDNNRIVYYYKIDGKDERWNYTKNHEIIFKDLKPGEYTFKIKAKNHNGMMSKETAIKFTVKPHILLSKYAILIYIILVIIIIRINRSKMKMLDRLVSNRTKQLREEMDKSYKLLNKIIQLEKRKNNYFVNLSHELRTPLNVISTTQQLILALNKNEEGISREKIDYHTNVMQKNTKRLLNLINNIIDTSKIEHGSYKISIKEEDIVSIVEETALGLKDYIEDKNIELIIDPEVEEKIIECDRYEIERCIVNLISNARKFTPEGGQIKVKVIDLGNKVKISVEDTGVGIDEKNLKSIFDRFNQVVDKNSEVKGGSGLGLTITKHIIDLHNGEALVESELNKGSKFIIILPVKINK